MRLLRTNSRPSAKPGYSLVELVVVLGIITLIGLSGIPSLASNNDRAALDQNAQRIKQLLIDARTRSLAPTKNDGSATAQNYQVVFGDFSQNVSNNQVIGDERTNSVALERGLSQCDSGDVQAGFSQVRSLSLPRNIFISKFYPASTRGGLNEDPKMAVRFVVGQNGFNCGKSSNPAISSTDLAAGAWIGVKGDNSLAIARYLVIELSGTKLNEQRYVVIDRKTSEVSVAKVNPQSFFNAHGDALAPKWSATEPFSFSVRCGSNDSDITVTYPRSLDRSVDAGITDPNLAVYYDISWDLGDNVFRPLAISYFYDLSQSLVNFSFNTTAISTATQPGTIKIRLASRDDYDNVQPQNNADPLLKWLEKSFSWSCGSASADEDDDLKDNKDNHDQDSGGNPPGVGGLEDPL